MGVYIKNMVMPDSCLDCPLYNGHGCKATMQMFHPVTNVGARVDSCPLIEIAVPHGRLIDADKLPIRDISVEYYVINGATEDDINNAPTVIETEGEE